MIMMSGCDETAQDRSCNKTNLHPCLRRFYAACLAAGIVSFVFLAFATSLKHVLFVRTNVYESIHSVPNGNRVNGDQIRFNTITGTSPKRGEELPMMKNGSEQQITVQPHTGPISEANGNCQGVNRKSELLNMVPVKFLSSYKNPCWYEPLTRADVYNGSHYKYNRKHSYDLTKEWKRRLDDSSESKRLRCLPFFFIAGHPKCGTTDLFKKLTSHPDVVKTLKEPHWWTKRRFGGLKNDVTKRVPFQDYLNLFDKAALVMEQFNHTNSQEEEEDVNQLIIGDASASTLWCNDFWWKLEENCGRTEPLYTTAHYVRHLLPHSKIIVILRDPTERLYSDFLFFHSRKKSTDDFHKEVLLAINSLRMCLSTSTMRSCIYNRTIAKKSRVRLRLGMYCVFLEEWFRVFPRQQFLVIRLEDYSLDRLGSLQTVFRFLGLRALTTEEEELMLEKSGKANARTKKDRDLGDMREDTRQLLNSFYRPYNQKLSDLLHDSKYLWSSKYQ